MGGEDESYLRFLDSLDGYLALLDSLSSTLRQGWLELASARHSMGSSRISSALFDLKLHPAATTVEVNESIGEAPSNTFEGTATNATAVTQPHFILSKWGSHGDGKCSSLEVDVDSELPKRSNGLHLRHRGFSGNQEIHPAEEPPLTVDDQVQKERAKSLSMFGTLVSPKLRASQVSFEAALEIIIEIANMRSLVLSTHSQLQEEKEGSN